MVTAWISAFLEVLTGLTSGVAQAVVGLFDTIFIKTSGDTTQLTTVAVLGIIVVASGLIIGLVRRITGKASK